MEPVPRHRRIRVFCTLGAHEQHSAAVLSSINRLYRRRRVAGAYRQTDQTRRACARATGRATRRNQRWSTDFVIDRFGGGRWFRILTVVDEYTRECLCAYTDRSQRGTQVVAQKKRLVTPPRPRRRAKRPRTGWAVLSALPGFIRLAKR
jgi:hypothetical protein